MHYPLVTIRKRIKHAGPDQQAFEFLEEHPIIRNLSDYGDVVRVRTHGKQLAYSNPQPARGGEFRSKVPSS